MLKNQVRKRFAVTILTLTIISAVALHAVAGEWRQGAALNFQRKGHTATLLPNGSVLVAGGVLPGTAFGSTNSAITEIYNPVSDVWTRVADMTTNRLLHSATLLQDGRVLVAGGEAQDVPSIPLASAEIYDPRTGKWTKTGSMTHTRQGHVATLLTNGSVLVIGGGSSFGTVLDSEIFDPSVGTWASAGVIVNANVTGFSMTRLSDGRVLVAGGYTGNRAGSSGYNGAFIFNPLTQIWTPTGSLVIGRGDHTATLLTDGRVLVSGGITSITSQGIVAMSTLSHELYDPMAGTWSVFSNSLSSTHAGHTSTLLQDGSVVITGGQDVSVPRSATAEFYTPSNGTWTLVTNALSTGRAQHTATMLGSGKVLFVGGAGGTNTDVYEPTRNPTTGTWTNTAQLTNPRRGHTATLVPFPGANGSIGKVMVVGGQAVDFISAVETFDPTSQQWTSNAPLNIARAEHTATLLPDGRLLVCGGRGINQPQSAFPTVEVFDSVRDVWTLINQMNVGRYRHTATLLRNGKVLVAGGVVESSDSTNSAEIFDPNTGVWSVTKSMITPRSQHKATLLPNGNVWVTGGTGTAPTQSAEIFDVASGTWSLTAPMNDVRLNHTSTLLQNGQVLVAGGSVSNGLILATAELYNPATGQWTNTGAMNVARHRHSATLLANGQVLVAGGDSSPLSHTAEVYDPTTGQWTLTGNMNEWRSAHASAFLPDGRVLAVSGQGGSFFDYTVELFDVGLGFNEAWRPMITNTSSPLAIASSLTLAGAQFRGVSDGSSGTAASSPSDCPVVQLRSVENAVVCYLLAQSWNDHGFTSAPLTNFPPGWAMATVFVNGISSASQLVNIAVPTPGPVTLNAGLVSGEFQISFTNVSGGVFGLLATTNVGDAPTNWISEGVVPEVAPGLFQFKQTNFSAGAMQFYRVSSP